MRDDRCEQRHAEPGGALSEESRPPDLDGTPEAVTVWWRPQGERPTQGRRVGTAAQTETQAASAGRCRGAVPGAWGGETILERERSLASLLNIWELIPPFRNRSRLALKEKHCNATRMSTEG